MRATTLAAKDWCQQCGKSASLRRTSTARAMTTTRLWCVFELAAYLHSRNGRKANLVVCPVSVGVVLLFGHFALALFHLLFMILPVPAAPADFWPVGVIIVVGLCFPSYTALAYIALEHTRSIDKIHRQVQNFTMEHASAACCAMQHVTRGGQPILCDRVIISRCITSWFGSLQSFEDNVRSQVREVLVHQLTYNTFTYSRLVQLTAPALFFKLDRLAHSVVRDGKLPVDQVLTIIDDWLIFLPTLFLIHLQLTYRLRGCCGTKLKQLLASFLVVLVGIFSYVVVAAGEAVCLFLIEDIALARLVIVLVLLPLALFVWWRVPRPEQALT